LNNQWRLSHSGSDGSEEDLATIMQTIGWWLKSTYQGMWLSNLQSAEETTFVGWLLFSAGDFNCDELSFEIALGILRSASGHQVQGNRRWKEKGTTIKARP